MKFYFKWSGPWDGHQWESVTLPARYGFCTPVWFCKEGRSIPMHVSSFDSVTGIITREYYEFREGKKDYEEMIMELKRFLVKEIL